MICRCFGRNLDLSRVAKRVGETAHLMVGLPDYATYAAHMRKNHPDLAPLTQGEFFRDRQASRYGGSGKAAFRCC
jgi:uncharacterized short protein YbdD (DUF466 family)